MNPRQRRGVLLIVISTIGALAVFFTVSGFVADVQSQVGPMEDVVRLTTDVTAFRPIDLEASVEVTQMPARWKPPLALSSLDDLAGLVPATNLPAGTLLQVSDLGPPPSVQPGEREIAINVDAETGVAGNITVGDIVDIIATRPGIDGGPDRAEIAIEAARILSIGLPQAAEPDPTTGAFETQQVVPITFVLPTADVLRLAYVESFSSTVRLALRSPVDDADLAPQEQLYAPVSGGGTR